MNKSRRNKHGVVVLGMITAALAGATVAFFLIPKFGFVQPVIYKQEQSWSNEKFAANYDKAINALNGMTLDEKIGQLLFVRVPNYDALSALKQYHFGGYVLFGRDLDGENKTTLAAKILGWQNASKIPLFIGIDEEGGAVSRFSYAGWDYFDSPQNLYVRGGFDLISSEESRKVKMLESLGINVNFAPVADTCVNQNAFIYERSFGKDSNATSEFIKTAVLAYQNSKVSTTLKHFPGYGNNADTHFGIAIDNRSLDDFEAVDFLPFKTGIDAGTNFVMFSHNIVSAVDSVNPASISPVWHQILTEKLGFSGIMITDDLSMGAIADYYHGEYPAEVQGVIAGNNMLVVSDYVTAFNNIKKAVDEAVITEAQIDYLLIPVLALKLE